MRILFLIHELALNGAVTALLQQVRYMCARGDTATILVPRLEGPAAALDSAFRDAGATIILAETELANYDVVVGCTIFAASALRQVAGRVPTAWWIHEGAAGVQTVFAQPKVAKTLAKVTKLIFPSRGIVERVWTPILNDLPPGRVEIIPAGVPEPPPGPAMRRPETAARILCVGSIYPRKRQTDLVRAIAMLETVPLQCVLVGQPFSLDPPGEDLIRARPDRFVLTGGLPPDEVQAWYRSADLFSLPSGDECMPIAPVEAAWHGLPVILADLDCYNGVWRHGVNALIHPVGDVELLAGYIRMLRESPGLRARFAAAGRTVAVRFSERRAGALFDVAMQEAIATFRPSA